MCIRHFVTIMASCCLLALWTGGGCNAEQLDQIDQAIEDVNDLGDLAQEVADSPAAAVLPPEVRLIMELLGIGASLALAVWRHLRAQGLAVTARTIILAVEQLPASTQAEVKAEVEHQMLRAGRYAQANAIVDELKET